MSWWDIKQLKSSDPAARAAAATRLGESKGPKDIEALLLAIRDPDPSVRLAIVQALGRTGDQRPIKFLVPMFWSPHGEFRREAGLSLLQLGPQGLGYIIYASRINDPQLASLAREMLALAQANPTLASLLPAAAIEADKIQQWQKQVTPDFYDNMPGMGQRPK